MPVHLRQLLRRDHFFSRIKMIKVFKEIGFAFFFGVIGSMVVGIAVLLAIAAWLQTPIYTLLVTAFFVPFNFSDLKRSASERRWIDLFIRSITLISIAGFIFGLIRFASGYGTFESYFLGILAFAVPVLFISITTYGLCEVLIPNNVAYLAVKTKVKDLSHGSRIAF